MLACGALLLLVLRSRHDRPATCPLHLTEGRVGDLFKSDFSTATVVTLYLLPNINAKRRPQLWKQLKVGTRVVSHAFDMGAEWPAGKTVESMAALSVTGQ